MRRARRISTISGWCMVTGMPFAEGISLFFPPGALVRRVSVGLNLGIDARANSWCGVIVTGTLGKCAVNLGLLFMLLVASQESVFFA